MIGGGEAGPHVVLASGMVLHPHPGVVVHLKYFGGYRNKNFHGRLSPRSLTIAGAVFAKELSQESPLAEAAVQ